VAPSYAGRRLLAHDGRGRELHEGITSKENDGDTWKAYNDQANISRGPYIMDFDRVSRIMYSASWEAGLWALRVIDP